MKDSQKVSTITIVVVSLIVIAIIVAVCFAMGFFSFSSGGEALSFDEPTQVTENAETREFIMAIEGEENVTVLETGEKVNSSTGIYSKYTLGDFELQNFDISCIDKATKITCSITNTAAERKTLDGFYILLNDQNGMCKTCKLVNGITLSAEETEEIDIIINEDVSNAYSISLKQAYANNN